MALREKEPVAVSKPKRRDEFNVTVESVIGTIGIGDGEYPPHVAAMMLIAEHDAEGVFRFPMGNGKVQQVHIQFISKES